MVKKAAAERKEVLGQPKGLWVLFLTEMWERFSFYGMRALLVLYLRAAINEGGLAWSQPDAIVLYGLYTMGVYLACVLGGIISDRYLGGQRSVLLGGILQCLGHFALAFSSITIFYLGLFLLALGTGLLKPNISSLVGTLYDADDPKRDKGYRLYYMGINIGAIFASIIVGTVGQKLGWHYGFSLAGLAMLVGLAIFLAGQGTLRSDRVQEPKALQPLTKKDGYAWGGMLALCLAAVAWKRIDSNSFDLLFSFHTGGLTIATIASIAMVSIFVYWLRSCQDSKERRGVAVVGLVALISLVFFTAFEQAGGLMNLYTKKYINLTLFGYEIPSSVFQASNPIFVVLLTPVIVALMARYGKKISIFSYIGMGKMIMGVGFLFMLGASLQRGMSTEGKAHMIWLIVAYFFHTVGELLVSPTGLSLINKASPSRIKAASMGFYFAAIGVGCYWAGKIGSAADVFGERVIFFSLFFIPLLVGLMIILLSKKFQTLLSKETETKAL
jgi:POT family proton-dependent oligopeptide transporter